MSNYTSSFGPVENNFTASDRDDLITAHNGTLPSAVFWVGGSKVRVNRFSEDQPQKGGGKRGKITGFSRGSRRRLMRKLAEVKRGVCPLWVGLTFPDEFHNSLAELHSWRKCFRRFEKRFTRRFPGGGLVWRLEFQDRKSGLYKGAIFPHYHLLVYGVSFLEFSAWVKLAWWEACGRLSGDHLTYGAHVDVLKSPGKVNAYISKYLAKVADTGRDIGRVWGIVGVENLPWVRAVLCQLTEQEAVQLIRYMRRFARLRSRDYKSLTVLLDAEFWWLALDRLLYPY